MNMIECTFGSGHILPETVMITNSKFHGEHGGVATTTDIFPTGVRNEVINLNA